MPRPAGCLKTPAWRSNRSATWPLLRLMIALNHYCFPTYHAVASTNSHPAPRPPLPDAVVRTHTAQAYCRAQRLHTIPSTTVLLQPYPRPPFHDVADPQTRRKSLSHKGERRITKPRQRVVPIQANTSMHASSPHLPSESSRQYQAATQLSTSFGPF